MFKHVSHWKELIGGSFTGLDKPCTLVTLWRQKELTKHTVEPSTGSWSSQVSLSSRCAYSDGNVILGFLQRKVTWRKPGWCVCKKTGGEILWKNKHVWLIQIAVDLQTQTHHITFFFSCNRQQSTWWGHHESARIYSDIRHTRDEHWTPKT